MLVRNTKAQVSFFTKILFIVVSSVAFVLFLLYVSSFRESVIKEREISNFKMATINVLQKLVSDIKCLAYEYNRTSKKGVIDLEKLTIFTFKYNETEPECAKEVGFDYHVEIVQFKKDLQTYPSTIKEKKCEERCYHRGYSCTLICYPVCWEETVVIAPGYKTSVAFKTWSFGLPINSFSPKKARFNELQISLPISIKYNETFAVEGILYLYAVSGELEKLYSLVEYICEQAELNPTKNIEFSSHFHFSFPIEFIGNELCMLNSCKKLICPFPTIFKGFNEGEYMVRFIYNSTTRTINIY